MFTLHRVTIKCIRLADATPRLNQVIDYYQFLLQSQNVRNSALSSFRRSWAFKKVIFEVQNNVEYISSVSNSLDPNKY